LVKWTEEEGSSHEHKYFSKSALGCSFKAGKSYNHNLPRKNSVRLGASADDDRRLPNCPRIAGWFQE
jgi:hypothetical protein